jgi:hypothetical protein
MNYAHALLIDEARCPFRTNNLPLFPRPLLAIIGTISFRRRNRKKGDELIEVTLVPQADTWEIQRLRARMEAAGSVSLPFSAASSQPCPNFPSK